MTNDMKTLTIKKSININAGKDKVWDVLFSDKFNRQWYAAFGEGVYAQTDWKVGSKAIFTDPAGDGLVAKVAENSKPDQLMVEYTGVLSKGKEDYESPMAKQLAGGQEKYFLKSNNRSTELFIECDMNEESFDSMSKTWDVALAKIKSLSEG
jgi:hypothetical protein